jgi:site-specific recombinase XerD
LLQYIVKFRGDLTKRPAEPFFLTIDGYGLSNESTRAIIRRIGAAAHVPRLHPHLFRHTYATNFLVNGGNVLILKQNLGHTTLSMVDHYVHLATSKVAVLSRDFSPLDRTTIPGLLRK